MADPTPNLPSKSKGYKPYLKYSAIWMQILSSILIFAFLGHWLDGYLSLDKAIFTAIFSLFGVGLGLYLGLKDFIKSSDKNNEKPAK